MMPYILGAVLEHATDNADVKGLRLEHEMLQKAGLDLSGASQGDGAGGAESAFFTPDFMVHYLASMAQQSNYAVFHRALPILGRDGTLVKIQAGDAAAGQVFAKTGTFEADDLLNDRFLLVGKGLAGYMTTASGQHLAFALYLNHVSLPHDPQAIDQVAGQALGAIAAAAWRLPIDKATLDTQ
jgi:D-alanyl-D-alanine carboxypeptidase/D-alanyl-D-alanine-endopeptidase (penicillin-binding protein 4)